MTDSELIALSALAQAESVTAQVTALHQQSAGDFVTGYGGGYGYGPYTTKLMDEMDHRAEERHA